MGCLDLQVAKLLSSQWEAQDLDRAPEQGQEQDQERALVKAQGYKTFHSYNLMKYDELSTEEKARPRYWNTFFNHFRSMLM